MSLEILHDPRLKQVPWHDLVQLSRFEVAKELLLPVPWLAGSWCFAHLGWYPAALACSFVFFLTGLRVTHNAFHHALGISRAATGWVMFLLSVLMLGSMHAVQFNHLRHHKHCMDDDDVEAMSARLPAWKALLIGPLFPFQLHHAALRGASPRQLRWIHAELAAGAIWVAAVLFLMPSSALVYHVAVMALGQCFTAFFAVWTVHHDCDRSHYIARTLRNRFKCWISFNMFFHMEHHLFARVPTCHLHTLAERLDRVAPELSEKQVF